MNARIWVLALALFAPVASAHDGEHASDHTHWWLELDSVGWDWSAGAALAQNTIDYAPNLNDGSLTSVRHDDKASGVRLFGAVAWGYAALEVGYADLGEATLTAQSDGSGSFWNAGTVASSLDVSGFDASFVGRIPMGQTWAIRPRVGVFMFDTEARLANTGSGDFSFGDSGGKLLYGVGIERAFGNWRVSADYQATKAKDGLLDDDYDIKSLSLSASYFWGGTTDR